jgi:hypothetical protein
VIISLAVSLSSLSIPGVSSTMLIILGELGVNLGRTVQQGAAEGPQKGLLMIHHLGETKVGQLDHKRMLRADQNVVRLHIAMSYVLVV